MHIRNLVHAHLLMSLHAFRLALCWKWSVIVAWSDLGRFYTAKSDRGAHSDANLTGSDAVTLTERCACMKMDFVSFREFVGWAAISFWFCAERQVVFFMILVGVIFALLLRGGGLLSCWISDTLGRGITVTNEWNLCAVALINVSYTLSS